MIAILLIAYFAIAALYWLLQLLALVLTMRHVPVLEAVDIAEPAEWPALSVIAAACNEADSIRAATIQRLMDDYPNLEIILVDDRSCDPTGAIIDELAAADARVKAVHVRELPAGWLGKLNALNEGLKRAGGEWILFSDADVRIRPGTLKKTVAFCLQRGLDHLALLPEIWSACFLINTIYPVFYRFLILATRIWKAEDPASRAAVGSGGFNLFRRSAYERSPGLEWLRMEIGDDMALAQMLKQSGGRTAVLNGRSHLGVTSYRTLGQVFHACERQGFTTPGHTSLLHAVLPYLLMIVLELAPFLALLPGAIPGWPLSGLTLLLIALARLDRHGPLAEPVGAGRRFFPPGHHPFLSGHDPRRPAGHPPRRYLVARHLLHSRTG